MTVFLLYETDTIQKTKTLIDIYGDKDRMLYDMEKFKKLYNIAKNALKRPHYKLVRSFCYEM